MKANDLGLSVHQMRLLTCAQIVRKSKDLEMRCFGTCAIGQYLREFPDAFEGSDAGPGTGLRAAEHFGMEPFSWIDIFSSTYPSDRDAIADRIEHFALHRHPDARTYSPRSEIE